jgi:hypothetical protein
VPDPALPSAALLPHSIGPYVAVMLCGFGVGILGHMTRSRWLITAGVILVFLGAFLFPLALNLSTQTPTRVEHSPPP